ncbi:MAG: flagellar protein FlgN [Deltaproteobacteria bacterium]|nr:flagellar protein FlgN [Deltaproteobacteria bacterium]
MNNLLDDLHKLLTDQTKLYRSLHGVLQQESSCISSSALDDLQENNKKKEVIVLQIQLLDESCSQLLEAIYLHLPHQPEPPSLNNLIGLVNEPDSRPLQLRHEKLLSMARAVKELNCDNENRITGALRAIKGSISFLMSFATDAQPCYESTGMIKQQPALAPLLSKEA